MVQRSLSARTLSILVCLCLCFPMIAAEPVTRKLKLVTSKAIDLQLGDGGALHGKVVDQQGNALENVKVEVANRHGVNAVVTTTPSGRFLVKGLSVGELTVSVDRQVRRVRAWNAETAAPNVAQEILLVVGDTVRAKCGRSCSRCVSCQPVESACGPSCGSCDACNGAAVCCPQRRLLARPIFIAGIAAAIAIPIAVDKGDAS